MDRYSPPAHNLRHNPKEYQRWHLGYYCQPRPPMPPGMPQKSLTKESFTEMGQGGAEDRPSAGIIDGLTVKQLRVLIRGAGKLGTG